VGEVEILDSKVREFEGVMLALRQRDGIDYDELMGGMTQSGKNELLGYLLHLRELGFCEPAEHRLALTPRGYLRSNAIIADIIRFIGSQ
jgi:coproporphyrinogen III oxidase-like Fe-S oxidoreductase